MSNDKSVLILPGDGIGPEVTAEAVRVLDWFRTRRALPCRTREGVYGLPALRKWGRPLTDETLGAILDADLVLFGASGGPELDGLPPAERMAGSLLRIRKEMGVYANLRPVKPFAALLEASPLRRDRLEGTDLVIVRELNGGIYFGTPRGIEDTGNGGRRGVNTLSYATWEVERVARAAFRLARSRRGRLVSVDKANVLEAGIVWREEVARIGREEFGDVELSHMYVDNAAMQIVRDPRQFDVIVTDNMFGDILSDCAAVLAGSLGMLASASLAVGATGEPARALYEPIHGSAPDIAGQGIANPLGAIMSVALALEHSFQRPEDARLLERAVSLALDEGARTRDLADSGAGALPTAEMGTRVLRALEALAP